MHQVKNSIEYMVIDLDCDFLHKVSFHPLLIVSVIMNDMAGFYSQ